MLMKAEDGKYKVIDNLLIETDFKSSRKLRNSQRAPPTVNILANNINYNNADINASTYSKQAPRYSKHRHSLEQESLDNILTQTEFGHNEYQNRSSQNKPIPQRRHLQVPVENTQRFSSQRISSRNQSESRRAAPFPSFDDQIFEEFSIDELKKGELLNPLSKEDDGAIDGIWKKIDSKYNAKM